MTESEWIMFLRQVTNNHLFVMDVVLFAILLLYILSHLKVYRLSAWLMVRVRAATWLAVHILGLTFQRGWGIVLLRAVARGQDPMSVESHFPLYLIGSVLADVGLAGTIYTFTPLAGHEFPSFWRRWTPLLLALTAASLFTVIMWAV